MSPEDTDKVWRDLKENHAQGIAKEEARTAEHSRLSRAVTELSYLIVERAYPARISVAELRTAGEHLTRALECLRGNR